MIYTTHTHTHPQPPKWIRNWINAKIRKFRAWKIIIIPGNWTLNQTHIPQLKSTYKTSNRRTNDRRAKQNKKKHFVYELICRFYYFLPRWRYIHTHPHTIYIHQRQLICLMHIMISIPHRVHSYKILWVAAYHSKVKHTEIYYYVLM